MGPCHTSHHTAVILQDTLQRCHAALQKLGISLFSSHCSLFLGSYLIFHTHLTPVPTQTTLGTWHLFSWFVMSWILDFERAVIEFFKTNGEYTTHPQNGWGWKVPLEIICQLTEGVLHLIVQVTNDDVKQHWTHNQPLGHSTSGWCPA